MSKLVTGFAIVLVCTALPALALASTGGYCTDDGKKFDIVDGAIYKTARFGDDINVPTIALANFKIDGKPGAEKDPDGALTVQRMKADHGGEVVILVGASGVISLRANFSGISYSKSPASGAIGDLKLSRNDASGVAGHYSFKGKTADDMSCDFMFDLAYAKPN